MMVGTMLIDEILQQEVGVVSLGVVSYCCKIILGLMEQPFAEFLSSIRTFEAHLSFSTAIAGILPETFLLLVKTVTSFTSVTAGCTGAVWVQLFIFAIFAHGLPYDVIGVMFTRGLGALEIEIHEAPLTKITFP